MNDFLLGGQMILSVWGRFQCPPPDSHMSTEHRLQCAVHCRRAPGGVHCAWCTTHGGCTRLVTCAVIERFGAVVVPIRTLHWLIVVLMCVCLRSHACTMHLSVAEVCFWHLSEVLEFEMG